MGERIGGHMPVALSEQKPCEAKPLPRRAEAKTLKQRARLEAWRCRDPGRVVSVETIHNAPRFPLHWKIVFHEKHIEINFPPRTTKKFDAGILLIGPGAPAGIRPQCISAANA
jgi:hypothetical protein